MIKFREIGLLKGVFVTGIKSSVGLAYPPHLLSINPTKN
jgi:hypothetical protein